jgi:hypothetical protein
MLSFIRRLREALVRPFRRPQRYDGLTAVEYEAVSLITYEGRDAYARAQEQADYCRAMGSPSGVMFWTEVAAEVDQRTGARGGKAKERPR